MRCVDPNYCCGATNGVCRKFHKDWPFTENWTLPPEDTEIEHDPSEYCECAALHSEGTEEADSGRCSACGGLL